MTAVSVLTILGIGFLGLLVGVLLTVAVAAIQRFRRRQVNELHPNLDTAGIPVLERLPIGAVVFDSALQVVYQNQLARSTPRLLAEVLEEDWFRRALDAALRDGQATTRPASADSPILVNVFLGGAGLVIALLSDETERLETEALRRDFIANASHELNTPVAAISLLSEAITSSIGDDAKITQFATSLQAEVDRLSSLTRDIVRLSQAQSKESVQSPQQVGIVELVSTVTDSHLDLAENQGLELRFSPRIEVDDIDRPPSEVFVQAEPRALAVAVANLIENAIQYSPAGTRVGVGIQLHGKRVDIQVTDQGPGIPPAERDNIFKRFYRLDGARTRVTGGTGLGLSIARNTVLNLGGDVTVWSKPGIGSTFTISLPMSGEVQATGPDYHLRTEDEKADFTG